MPRVPTTLFLSLSLSLSLSLPGTIVAYLPKLRPGQHFENLGMITSLLSKKPAKNLGKFGASPRIDEVTTCNGTSGDGGDGGGEGSDGGGGDGGGDGGDEIGEESDEFDWEIEQQLTTDENDVSLFPQALYLIFNSFTFAYQINTGDYDFIFFSNSLWVRQSSQWCLCEASSE